jgi:hypothetical protein
MARKPPTPTKPRACSLCGTTEGAIRPYADGFICLPCMEQGRTGRDATTRAARAMKYSMGQRALVAQLRDWGEDANADIHEAYADEYEGKAKALSRVDAIPPMVLGEAVPAKHSRLVDTLKLPDVAALDASAHRLELLGRMGNDSAAMALDAAASIEAGNSLEKMLAHQLAVAHKTALQLTDKGTFQHDAEEKARLLNLACRMMESYQRGLLTLARLRNSDRHHVALTVAEGGQAVVIVGIYEGK